MKEQLELKHIAPYLAYGLKIEATLSDNGYKLMTMCDKGGLSNISISDVLDDIESLKPILRPLSDLTKEIEVNGESFVMLYYISTSKADSQQTMRRVAHEQSLDVLEYWKIERLFEWHFDVFGLIEKGLAISYEEAGL